MTQQKTADEFPAVAAPAVISTRTGQWGSTHSVACRQSREATPRWCPSCERCGSPAGGSAFGSCLWKASLRAAERHREGTASPFPEYSRKPRLKVGSKEALLCPQFSIENIFYWIFLLMFYVDTTSRNAVLLLGTKEAGTGSHLGAVLELFIARNSPGVQETFLLQAQAATISPKTLRTVMSDSLGLCCCLPHWTEHPRHSTTMGNFHGFLPLLYSSLTDSVPYNFPHGLYADEKILLYLVL